MAYIENMKLDVSFVLYDMTLLKQQNETLCWERSFIWGLKLRYSSHPHEKQRFSLPINIHVIIFSLVACHLTKILVIYKTSVENAPGALLGFCAAGSIGVVRPGPQRIPSDSVVG
jgi:hypothetical protein